jgi:predicted HTH domain antitoxin
MCSDLQGAHFLPVDLKPAPCYNQVRLASFLTAKTIGRLNMSATIAIEIPREIIHVTRMSPQALKRELALYLFEQDKLSFGKARELAEMTVWEFQQLLGSRGILIHYDVEDYEQDLAALKELGQL